MKTVRLTAELDGSSLSQLIHDLEDFKEDLKKREDLLLERIADEIRNSAQSGFDSAVFKLFTFIRRGGKNVAVPAGDEKPSVSVTSRSDGDHVMLVIASGSEAAFVEFGTGVYYNGAAGSSPHPEGSKLGMTIGEYGLGNGKKNVWGFYQSPGNLVFTRGFAATMPLYNACLDVCRTIGTIADGVFT